jgi:hypothetical protein
VTNNTQTTLAGRVEAIEQAYEFMLAYAAQGREDDGGGPIREFIARAVAALDGLAASVADALSENEALAAFLEVMQDDARKAEAALRLVLARSSISSQLVDNLNASIHLRALLTDVFLIDEALKRPGDLK